MLTEICQELRNWFLKSDRDKHIGTFTISGGVLTPSIDLKPNQYFRIIGSVFNDGVHKYLDSSDVLTDEKFNGAVWVMYVPNDVLALVSDITTYESKYGETSPYTSESFGGYSYSKATDSNGNAISWRGAFASRLNKWRKL